MCPYVIYSQLKDTKFRGGLNSISVIKTKRSVGVCMEL